MTERQKVKQPTQNLLKFLPKLVILMKAKNDKTRKVLLDELCRNKQVFKALKEIIDLLQNRHIPLTKYRMDKVRKFKKTIKAFGKRNFDQKQQKTLVKQSGGFLHYLIPGLISVLTTVLNGTV